MIIQGEYLDGKNSSRYPARLEFSPHDINTLRLYVHTADDQQEQLLSLSFEKLKVESQIGNTPREIIIQPDGLFITADNSAINELLKQHQSLRSSNLIHKLEGSLPLILISIIAAIVMIWATTTIAIPKSAEYLAFQLPELASSQFDGNLAILDESLFSPSELPRAQQQQIRELLAPYLAEFAALNPKVEFRSGMKANALALPSGEIIFTDEFVRLVKHDKELLSVFFHELGHLQHKHMTRRALQGSMLTILIILITGDLDTVDLMTGIPALILDLSYSRDFEREADDFALKQMQRHDIPLHHFASIMQRLEEYYLEPGKTEANTPIPSSLKKASDYLSTHPSTDERVKLIERYQSPHSD